MQQDEPIVAMRSLFPDRVSWVTASTACRYRFEFLGWCEFSKGLVAAAHAHDYYEAGLILGGEGKLQLGARSIRLSSGDAYVVVPGSNHRVVPTRETPLSGVFFNINAEANSSDDLAPSFAGLEKSRHVKTKALQQVVSAALEHHATESMGRISTSLLARYLVSEVLGALADELPPAHSLLLSAALKYIEEHLGEGLEIKGMSEFLGVSERTLRRRFQSELGVSISEHVAGRRVQLAEKYLSFNLTVGAVAQMVGFESPSQLSRLFVREKGITPKAWQKEVAPRRRIVST